ncbi:MAG: phosphoribosylformylglycinamidine synthase subunit PurS [Nanoarchaeota archaeon]
MKNIKTVEMVVGLKVPDNTAITTLQTLRQIGFNNIQDVKRADYYKFSIEGNVNKFKEKICKVDILVNANKHFFEFELIKNASPKACVFFVMVKNINDEGSGILSALKKRLEFKNIKKVDKAVLWSLTIDAEEKGAETIAEKAAKELLVNENYQEFEVL